MKSFLVPVQYGLNTMCGNISKAVGFRWDYGTGTAWRRTGSTIVYMPCSSDLVKSVRVAKTVTYEELKVKY